MRTLSGGKYNTGKKNKLSTESLERLSFIQKTLLCLSLQFIHFPLNFSPLCLSISSLSHAEVLLRGRDCRLASRLMSLLILLSCCWLTNPKKEDVLPVFKCSKLRKVRGTEGQRTSSYFQSAMFGRWSTGFQTSLSCSTQRDSNVPFRKHIAPFI